MIKLKPNKGFVAKQIPSVIGLNRAVAEVGFRRSIAIIEDERIGYAPGTPENNALSVCIGRIKDAMEKL